MLPVPHAVWLPQKNKENDARLALKAGRVFYAGMFGNADRNARKTEFFHKRVDLNHSLCYYENNL